MVRGRGAREGTSKFQLFLRFWCIFLCLFLSPWLLQGRILKRWTSSSGILKKWGRGRQLELFVSTRRGNIEDSHPPSFFLSLDLPRSQSNLSSTSVQLISDQKDPVTESPFRRELLSFQPPPSLLKMSSPELTSSRLFKVKGKVVLITGGGTGLGKAMATGFVQSGAKGESISFPFSVRLARELF